MPDCWWIAGPAGAAVPATWAQMLDTSLVRREIKVLEQKKIINVSHERIKKNELKRKQKAPTIPEEADAQETIAIKLRSFFDQNTIVFMILGISVLMFFLFPFVYWLILKFYEYIWILP